jgi:hypothetical protein
LPFAFRQRALLWVFKQATPVKGLNYSIIQPDSGLFFSFLLSTSFAGGHQYLTPSE